MIFPFGLRMISLTYTNSTFLASRQKVEGWGEETFCLRAVRSPAAGGKEKSVARKIREAENIFLRGTRAERAAAGRFSPRPDVRQNRFGF